MAEAPAPASDHKRATWVGLRTLRQRPKVVDHLKNGEPIFEVRSVRLVLRDNADHFNRLAQCSKCGRDVAGAPVLAQADLTRASHSVICRDCVRTATRGTQWKGPAGRGDVNLAAAELLDVPDVEAAVVAEALVEVPDDGRLAAIESQLALLMSRLTELATTVQSEGVHRRLADDAVQSELRAALAEGLEEARAQVVPPAGADTGPSLKAFEDRLGQRFASVVELVQTQRNELTAVTAEVSATRAELRRVAAAKGEPATFRNDVDRRLSEITTWISAQPSHTVPMEELRSELKEAEYRLAGSIDSQRAELHAALSAGLDVQLAAAEARLAGAAAVHPIERPMAGADGLIQGFRHEMDEAESRVTRLVESSRDEVAAAVTDRLNDAFRGELAAVETRLARSVESQLAEWEATLTDGLNEAIRRQLEEAEARVAATAEAQHAELRLVITEVLTQAREEVASLDQRVRESEVTFTRLVETHRKEIGTNARHELTVMVRAVQELTDARDQLDRKLDGLLENAIETEVRMSAFAAAAGDGASRLEALETRTRTSIDRLAGLLDSERRMRLGQEARDAIARQGQLEAAPDGAAGTGSLLDDLDRQLQQADRRLARWGSSTDRG